MHRAPPSYNEAFQHGHGDMIPCYSHRTAIYAQLLRLVESAFGGERKIKDGE